MPDAPAIGPAPVAGRGLSVGIVLLGLAAGLIGNLARIPDLVIYGFISCVAGLLLAALGTQRGKRFWAPYVYLLFMLPLPNFLYWRLSLALQLISSKLGVAFISVMGVPVFLDGNVIDLGVYKLQVAEACSGLAYLFPLASFGFLFTALYKGPIWHKLILFSSTLPITILMNSTRIGTIGLLVDRFGIEQAEGFLHFFEGWTIFIACIALLCLEALLLQRLVARPQPIRGMLELNLKSLVGQVGQATAIQPTWALTFGSVLVLVAGLAWGFTPPRASLGATGQPLALFPMQFGDWRGDPRTLDEPTERVLAADDYLLADYRKLGSDTVVNFLITYYKSTTESHIHSPESCIPGGGWEVLAWTTFDTGIRTAAGRLLSVNRAIIQKGLSRQLVYYWFEERGRSLSSEYVAKAYTILDAVTRGRTDGGLIRLVTPLPKYEDVGKADERLREFLQFTVGKTPAFIPS